MDKSDYINKATEKIFSLKAKRKVSIELEQHIDEKIDFFIEIGYENDAAQEKALEAMGEAEEVSKQLGELHNDFHNPFFDCVIMVVWLGILGGIYYLLDRFIFGDVGLSSILVAASCLSFALLYGHNLLSLLKNKLLPVIFSFFGAAATFIFNYYVFIQLDKGMAGSLSALLNFVVRTDIPSSSNYFDKKRIIAAIAVILVTAVMMSAFSLVYFIKVNSMNNSLFDKKARNFIRNFLVLITIIWFAFSVLFSVKSYFDLNSIKNEYYEAYDYVAELTEKCATKEEVIDYIKQGEYAFEEETDVEGNVIGYTYKKNIVYIDVAFAQLKSRDEIKAEYKEELKNSRAAYDEFIDEYLPEIYDVPEYEEVLAEFEKYYSEYADEYARREYSRQTYMSITLSPFIILFDNSYDKLSTSFLRVEDDELDMLHAPEVLKLNNVQKFDFYKKLTPTRFKAIYYAREIDNCQYDFEFITDSGMFKHSENRTAIKKNDRLLQILDKMKEIAELIGDNNSMSSKEIAKLTGSILDMPEMTREEYEKKLSSLGSRFDREKQLMMDSYDMTVKFCYDDWYFVLIGRPYNKIIVFDEYQNSIEGKRLTSEPVILNYDAPDGQEKVRINGGYYDKNGLFYPQPDYVPYYTENGEKYYYYCKTIEDKTHTVGNTKEYYLTNRKNSYYDEGICFIDSNGYLYIDVSNSLKYDNASMKYKSASGQEYTKAFATSWDSEGNAIMQDSENESTNSLIDQYVYSF